MQRQTILTLGISIASSIAWIAPASAVPVNQSDITGTNVWNNTAPIFESEQQFNTETINTARGYSEAIERASAACDDSLAAVANLPRRFARGEASSAEVCISRECEQLNQVLQEARSFLSNLDSSREQQLRAMRNSKTW